MNDIDITVNTEYKKYEQDFLTAYKEKKVINRLLELAKVKTDGYDFGFLDCEFYFFTIARRKDSNKWFVDRVTDLSYC